MSPSSTSCSSSRRGVMTTDPCAAGSGGGGAADFTVEVGDLTTPTSTGAQVVNLSNFSGKTIKAIIFFGETQTVAGANGDTGWMLGFATSSTENVVMASGSHDAVVTSDTRSIFMSTTDNRSLFLFKNGSSPGGILTSYGQGHVSTFGDNQFTITWDNAPDEAFKVNYIVLGGPDISCAIKDLTTPTSDGEVGYTSIGFLPTGLIALGTLNTTNAVNNVSNNVGFSDGTNEKNFHFTSRGSQSTSSTKRRQTTHFFDLQTVTDFARGTADVVSLDSDGFTLDWTNTTASEFRCAVLAISDVSCQVGVETQKTSTGTKATPTTFEPKALLTGSFCNVANAGTIDHRLGVFGGSDGTTYRTAGTQDKNGLTTMDTNGWMSAFSASGSVIEMRDEDVALVSAADVDSFNSTDFTLNWTTADATAREFMWLVLG